MTKVDIKECVKICHCHVVMFHVTTGVEVGVVDMMCR